MLKLKNDAKPSVSPSRDVEVQQKLETLREEYNYLHTKKITTDANTKILRKISLNSRLAPKRNTAPAIWKSSKKY